MVGLFRKFTERAVFETLQRLGKFLLHALRHLRILFVHVLVLLRIRLEIVELIGIEIVRVHFCRIVPQMAVAREIGKIQFPAIKSSEFFAAINPALNSSG